MDSARQAAALPNQEEHKHENKDGFELKCMEICLIILEKRHLTFTYKCRQPPCLRTGWKSPAPVSRTAGPRSVP